MSPQLAKGLHASVSTINPDLPVTRAISCQFNKPFIYGHPTKGAMRWDLYKPWIMAAFASAPLHNGSVLKGSPLLSYITPPWVEPGSDIWLSKVRESASGGANIVQIRDKGASTDVLRRVGASCVSAVEGTSCLVLINGDVDAAVESGAHGVHLPERFLEDIPQVLQRVQRGGSGKGRGIVGISVHSVEAAVRAARLGPSYIQVGTMFPTASHPEKGSEVEGPGLITRVAEALEAEGLRRGVALLGVGGIEPHNCAQVVEAGADGVCAIGALYKSTDPAATARALLQAMTYAKQTGES